MADPLVDIIVPIYGKQNLVEECIGRLESTTSVPYRLTLINDASPDAVAMKKYLGTKITKANVLHNFQNLGFPKTCNKAVRATHAKYICLLNSDTVPLPGWLDVLVDDLESNPKHAIAGPLLLFSPDSQSGPGGRVQHAGIYFDVQRVPHHRYIGWPADHPRVREYRDDLQAVTGACMLIRRSVWNEIGGFDEVYGRGTFEDCHFSIMVKLKGYKIVYCPDAMLYHQANGSSRDSGGFPLQVNYRIFVDRLGGLVQYDEWSVVG